MGEGEEGGRLAHLLDQLTHPLHQVQQPVHRWSSKQNLPTLKKDKGEGNGRRCSLGDRIDLIPCPAN